MGSELRLGDVTTTGPRRRIRNLVFSLAALPGLLALALLPFAGRTRGDHFVHTLTAASNIPLVVGISLEVAMLLAWRGRLWRTLLLMSCAGLASLVAAFATSFHGSTQIRPVSNDAESIVAGAFAIAALLCLVVMIAECILVATERAQPPSDGNPSIPQG